MYVIIVQLKRISELGKSYHIYRRIHTYSIYITVHIVHSLLGTISVYCKVQYTSFIMDYMGTKV